MIKSRIGLNLNHGIGMIDRVNESGPTIFYFQPFSYLLTTDDIILALTEIRKRFFDENIESTVCITDSKDRITYRKVIIDKLIELKFGIIELISLDTILCQTALYNILTLIHNNKLAIISNYSYYIGCYFWIYKNGKIHYINSCYSDLKNNQRTPNMNDIKTLKNKILLNKNDLFLNDYIFIDDQINDEIIDETFTIQEKCKIHKFKCDQNTLTKISLFNAKINIDDYFEEKQKISNVNHIIDLDIDLIWNKQSKVMDFHTSVEIPFEKSLDVTERGILEILDSNPLENRYHPTCYHLHHGSYVIRINKNGIIEVIDDKGKEIKPSKHSNCKVM